ncbi:DUF2071 domain-containing protein [Streptomyces sp. ms191]|uniref:YqjF family protein n=1 Tax=Streptomyces sp. ms191 TaxID=1827978 RepID=UPI0011CDEA3D|nr:DUF2071 domain-containing protein [Streptomyces sp. ms191]TXS13209.1 DUF2071 domain-containing protein [Streptomyces sp. ms191]
MERPPLSAVPEPLSRVAPHVAGRILFRQSWDDLVFLHWPVDPGDVAHLFPAGTRPDVIDGATYIGLVYFQMRRLALGVGPALPLIGTFTEINVRLYSVDTEGRRGVVFRTLDCERLLPSAVARSVWGLPYRWAATRKLRFGDRIIYTTRRRQPGGPTSRVWAATGTQGHACGPLGDFLTARWGLHARAWGSTYFWPVDHAPWTFRDVSLLSHDDDLVEASTGLRVARGMPTSVLYSPGVRVRFGTPRRLRGV